MKMSAERKKGEDNDMWSISIDYLLFYVPLKNISHMEISYLESRLK
jgi:hypothetical protein